MSTNTMTATVIINNSPPVSGDLTVEQEMMLLTSISAVKPDPKWEHIDAAGHFHAYTADGELPTLKHESVPVPCDDEDCACGGEGYYTSRWTCRICGEEIEPRTVPDHQARTTGIPTPGRKSAEVVVRSADDLGLKQGADVTLRVDLGDMQLIGIGRVVSQRGGMDGGTFWQETRIAAMGPIEPRLGTHKKART